MLPEKEEPMVKRPQGEESEESLLSSCPPAAAAPHALLPELAAGQGDVETVLQPLAEKPMDIQCDPSRSEGGDATLYVASMGVQSNSGTHVGAVGQDLSTLSRCDKYLELKSTLNLLSRWTKGSVKAQDGAMPSEPAEGNGYIEVIRSYVKEESQAVDKLASLEAVVRNLLRCGVGTNTEQVKEVLWNTESAAVVKVYVDIVPDQVRGEAGRCGLLAAARDGRSEVMVTLLEAGVDANARIYGNCTALHLAALYGHTACVQELLGRGADANAKDLGGGTPLHKASARGHAECVRELLEKCADVNAKENNGWTPLHEACCWGKAKCVQELLGRGVEVNVKDNLGKTPLHRASSRGHAEVVRMLVEKGADVKVKDRGGWTCLHWASERGRLGCVRVLLEGGAEYNARDNSGKTPIHRANMQNHWECFEELVKRVPKCKPEDITDGTPYHPVFNGELLEIIRELTQARFAKRHYRRVR